MSFKVAAWCWCPPRSYLRLMGTLMLSSSLHLLCAVDAFSVIQFANTNNYMRHSLTDKYMTTIPRGINYQKTSSSSLGVSSIPTDHGTSATEVIYNKVVRPYPGVPDILFLGFLVEYIECRFKLPNNLPMVYETFEGGEGEHCVIAWDSPLSPSPDATRMEVEVVGVYTDSHTGSAQEEKMSVPNMAMVVVRKDKSSSSIPPMMKNLFAQSEKQILRALDRGLDDFAAGRIKFDPNQERPPAGMRPNVRSAEEAIKIEMMDSVPEKTTPTTKPDEVIFDTVASTIGPDEETTTKKTSTKSRKSTDDDRRAAFATMQTKAKTSKSPPGKKSKVTEIEDFAVNAAARVAVAKQSAPKKESAAAEAKKKAAASADRRKKVAAAAAAAAPPPPQPEKPKQKRQHEAAPPSLDFAVEAARKLVARELKKMDAAAAENKSKRQKIAVEDIGSGATPNGKRTVTPKGEKKMNQPESKARKAQHQRQSPQHPHVTEGAKMDIPENFKIPDYMGDARLFRTTISHPDNRKRKKPTSGSSRSQTKPKPPATKASADPIPKTKRNIFSDSRPSIENMIIDLPSDYHLPSIDNADTPPSSTASSTKSSKNDDEPIDLLSELKSVTGIDVETESDSQKTPSSSKNDDDGIIDVVPELKKESPTSTKQEPSSTSSSKNDEPIVDVGSDLKSSIEKERKLNAHVLDADTDDPFEDMMAGLEGPKETDDDNNRNDDETSNKVLSREQMEDDVVRAAQRVMNEISEQAEDMTAKELLADVLKFGEAQEKEKQPGSGFVSGAFDKAKELLREQKEKANTSETRSTKTLTQDEELKKMFEAGERFADMQITKSESTIGGFNNDNDNKFPHRLNDEENKFVDELLADEKSISSHARVLDDELVELELAINPTPGEELDGPKSNPMFDVMSGPEVYDPNVELDTVNYPGAMPGTKEVKKPKQLDEAIKQAEFAVEVLSRLKTTETEESDGTKKTRYFSAKRELTQKEVDDLTMVAAEATQVGLIANPLELMAERSRLQLIIDELTNQPDERFREIASNYKDLVLSDNFVRLVRERLEEMAQRDLDALRNDDESLKEPHKRERDILGMLVSYAQLLLKETRALGAELEAQQLEVVRSICKVAMDPSHQTEEETAMALTDVVRDMRPLLDDIFVAYLKYAVAEEEARLSRAGLLDDPEHNQWLFVLKIVQQGVYKEIAKSINRYIEHIWYVLRMKTAKQRKMLLARIIDDLPTMDVRPFVQVVDNIVGSLGDGARGEFDGVIPLGELTNELLQLHRDVQELLPPERIALKSRDADEWAAKQKKKLLKARKAVSQRLEAGRQTEHRDGEVDALYMSGEVERFDQE